MAFESKALQRMITANAENLKQKGFSMSAQPKLWIATGNSGKMEEFKLLLKNLPFKIHSQKELSVFSQPPENGKTFLDNARIKAKALKSVVDAEDWVLADDSGLCVAGLGGLPGIHSARYAGDRASMAENIAKLLKMMQIRNIVDRKAHFECTLVLITATGEEKVFSGELKGLIAPKITGTQGFGYDPVFIPEGFTQTLGELENLQKNTLSHRSVACKKLTDWIAQA